MGFTVIVVEKYIVLYRMVFIRISLDFWSGIIILGLDDSGSCRSSLLLVLSTSYQPGPDNALSVFVLVQEWKMSPIASSNIVLALSSNSRPGWLIRSTGTCCYGAVQYSGGGGDVVARVTVEDCAPGSCCQEQLCCHPVRMLQNDMLVFLVTCWRQTGDEKD